MISVDRRTDNVVIQRCVNIIPRASRVFLKTDVDIRTSHQLVLHLSKRMFFWNWLSFWKMIYYLGQSTILLIRSMWIFLLQTRKRNQWTLSKLKSLSFPKLKHIKTPERSWLPCYGIRLSWVKVYSPRNWHVLFLGSMIFYVGTRTVTGVKYRTKFLETGCKKHT